MEHRNILETIRMLDEDKLDIRTLTLGVNLLDCISGDTKTTQRNIYDKITRLSEHLVEEGDRVGKKYGVTVVNKRIAITPMAHLVKAHEDLVSYASCLDTIAHEVGVDFIGGFSARVEKGMTPADRALIAALPVALATTERVCASVALASSKAGINMDAVALMGETIRACALATKERDSLGCAKLVVFSNAVEDNPFMAGAFHGVGESDAQLSVGVSGPGVVKRALEKCKGAPFHVLSEEIKKTAFRITRMGELVAREVAENLDLPFGIIDLSLAPTPAIGDSVARILEEMGLSVVGAHGTTAALALLNDAVKKGGMMASSHVGGLSGAFIPVSEDEGMIAAAQEGSLGLDKLEAMTCVCSVGLDMIAIPGDTSAATIAGMIADEAAIGMINHKTTAVRIIPVIGKTVGEEAVFGGLLGRAPILPVHGGDSSLFAARGGRIPAPLTSLKN